MRFFTVDDVGAVRDGDVSCSADLEPWSQETVDNRIMECMTVPFETHARLQLIPMANAYHRYPLAYAASPEGPLDKALVLRGSTK